MDRPGGGFAAGDIGEVHAITGRRSPGIGCAFDAFSGTAYGIKAYWAHILITHEMVNNFTGQIVGGGWPVDWWANHRSPFPLMPAVEIEYALVPNMAVFHERQGRSDPLVGMFMHLKDQYGWAMLRKAFRAAIDDGIRWDAFGGNPSALRTAYVAAYLQIGAPEDISSILAPLVPKYDAQTVKDIVEDRSKWTALPENSSRRQTLKKVFLRGDYQAVTRNAPNDKYVLPDLADIGSIEYIKQGSQSWNPVAREKWPVILDCIRNNREYHYQPRQEANGEYIEYMPPPFAYHLRIGANGAYITLHFYAADRLFSVNGSSDKHSIPTPDGVRLRRILGISD
jgi:hypothetical protein